MARPRSEFLGSLGKLFSIFKKIVDMVLELGGSDEDIASIGTDEQKTRAIAQIIVGNLPPSFDLKHSRSGWTVRARYVLADCTSLSRDNRTDYEGRSFFVLGRQTDGEYIGFVELPQHEGDDPVIHALFPGMKEPARFTPAEFKERGKQ